MKSTTIKIKCKFYKPSNTFTFQNLCCDITSCKVFNALKEKNLRKIVSCIGELELDWVQYIIYKGIKNDL